MTHCRRIMLEELQRRNFAPTTISTYLHAVEQFARENCQPKLRGRGVRLRLRVDDADHLARVIEAVEPAGRVVIVGHSMGGMTLMALAEARPELFGPAGLVAGVALLSTSSGKLATISFGLPTALTQVTRRLLPLEIEETEQEPEGGALPLYEFEPSAEAVLDELPMTLNQVMTLEVG